MTYRLHSSSDFETLKTEVTARLKAQAEKAEALQTVATMAETQTTEGLSPHEIAVLVTIMSERSSPHDGLAPSYIKGRMRNSGYTAMAVGLALESLSQKEMIEYFEEETQDGMYTAARLTKKGSAWLLANQDRFLMRRDESKQQVAPHPAEITDEDIPF